MKKIFCLALLIFSMGRMSLQAQSNEKKKIDDLSIDEFLTKDYSELVDLAAEGRGKAGSYGARAQAISSGLNVNGFLTTEFKNAQNTEHTFDNHYFVLFFNKQLTDAISTDAQLEIEHGGESIQLLFAHVDYKVDPRLIVRAGKFIIPSSPLNEYFYPDFLSKTIERDYINTELSPTVWGETGLQLRGIFEFSPKIDLYYAAYVVNGLEGLESNTIRESREDNLDRNNSSKSFGYRLGTTINKQFEIGTWNYYGRYHPTKKLNLLLGGVDFTYRHKGITGSVEYQYGFKDFDNETQDYSGFAVIAAYKYKMLEPVIRFDTYDNEVQAAKNV